ncbi:MAG: hypothetical protein O2992_12695, partial [Gemmatimonadetes bacterium]|nr:hypothetical protein [Gemmatimonadota bacterium]
DPQDPTDPGEHQALAHERAEDLHTRGTQVRRATPIHVDGPLHGPGEGWRAHWGLPYPAGAGETQEEEVEAFREIRDELRTRLEVVFGRQRTGS